jgi:lipoprotein-anchoring transpeptidase ErfK/SrfK
MRLRYLIPPFLIACVAAGGGLTAHAASDRQKAFTNAGARLQAEWDHDVAVGVPASSLAPLRAELTSRQPAAAWWSPSWFGSDGATLLTRLRTETQSAWNAALAAQRTQAQTVIAQWTDFASQQSTWLTGDAVSSAAGWSAQLNAAATPAAISALISSWQSFVGQQRTAVVTAQQTKLAADLAAELRSAGGPQAVLATARRLVGVAASANLDAGNVAALTAQLSNEIAAKSSNAIATGEQLLTAVSALQSLVNLNNQIDGQMRPLLYSADQAQAEGTPKAAALAGQQAAIAAQFRAARTTNQINAVAVAVTALQGQITAELAAHQCGHAVGAGKVITMSLSLQEMIFYQDGCVANATPITTGRPQLRTPTGRFSIFYKTSPFTFISPWPLGSPFYYYPSPVSWVMEFAAGGYFIHDAPWEASSSYGPGGEDNLSAASHGCVHTPTSTMQWAYAWTPLRTPVVISA